MTAYARREEILITLLGGVVTLLLALGLGWWALIPAVLTLALLSFYRDPPRRSPPDKDVILAPADGRVVEITRAVTNPDGNPCVRIMIFLSVTNVHINRSPCAATVTTTNYRPGRFINALSSAADTQNESNTLLLAPEPPLPGPIRVRQIAGVLARRIVCAVQPQDRLAAGQRFGMIKLGSRTEICLPEDPGWVLCTQVGGNVKAGLTILARFQPQS